MAVLKEYRSFPVLLLMYTVVVAVRCTTERNVHNATLRTAGFLRILLISRSVLIDFVPLWLRDGGRRRLSVFGFLSLGTKEGRGGVTNNQLSFRVSDPALVGAGLAGPRKVHNQRPTYHKRGRTAGEAHLRPSVWG